MLPASKDDFPKLLYLVQNKWIGLARRAKSLCEGHARQGRVAPWQLDHGRRLYTEAKAEYEACIDYLRAGLARRFNAEDPQRVTRLMEAANRKLVAFDQWANRYDGIDLPGTDCRMLVVYGRPTGATLLERYFLERLGATSVLRDRIRTRVTQAVGRCTRDEGDFSVVVLMGEDLVDWCSTTANVAGLHPELQAEISFGLANSENLNDRARSYDKRLAEAP
jgi:Helicase C-terminal domain